MAGEVGSVGRPLALIHRVLEQRAEDFRPDVAPVGRGRLPQLGEFARLKFQVDGLGEQAAVEIIHALVPTTVRFAG